MPNLPKSDMIKDFAHEFLKVKEMGWIPSNRFHDTGIGKTFEDFIGVIENNKTSADYKGLIELKSARELSGAMVTLFTKSPDPKGINNVLRKTFGYFDGEFKDMKILHTTFSADKFNTCKDCFGFALFVDNENKKILIKIKDLKTDKIDDSVTAYYPFDKIRAIVEHKCKYIIFISAESKKEEGKEFFKFNKATLLYGMTFDKFLEFIKQGIIKYDFRLGVYRTGKNKGKTHDHGSGFRINKKNLDKVFLISEID